MKKIKCRDLGMNCKYFAEGRTNSSTKKRMIQHAMNVHPIKMSKMTKVQMKSMDKKMDKLLSK